MIKVLILTLASYQPVDGPKKEEVCNRGKEMVMAPLAYMRDKEKPIVEAIAYLLAMGYEYGAAVQVVAFVYLSEDSSEDLQANFFKHCMSEPT